MLGTSVGAVVVVKKRAGHAFAPLSPAVQEQQRCLIAVLRARRDVGARKIEQQPRRKTARDWERWCAGTRCAWRHSRQLARVLSTTPALISPMIAALFRLELVVAGRIVMGCFTPFTQHTRVSSPVLLSPCHIFCCDTPAAKRRVQSCRSGAFEKLSQFSLCSDVLFLFLSSDPCACSRRGCVWATRWSSAIK